MLSFYGTTFGESKIPNGAAGVWEQPEGRLRPFVKRGCFGSISADSSALSPTCDVSGERDFDVGPPFIRRETDSATLQ